MQSFIDENALLQNVGAIHQSPFTITSEFIQNPVKSLGVRGHLLL
jgi:hypothetical protein